LHLKTAQQEQARQQGAVSSEKYYKGEGLFGSQRFACWPAAGYAQLAEL
jgi:hypothetical protein